MTYSQYLQQVAAMSKKVLVVFYSCLPHKWTYILLTKGNKKNIIEKNDNKSINSIHLHTHINICMLIHMFD